MVKIHLDELRCEEAAVSHFVSVQVLDSKLEGYIVNSFDLVLILSSRNT